MLKADLKRKLVLYKKALIRFRSNEEQKRKEFTRVLKGMKIVTRGIVGMNVEDEEEHNPLSWGEIFFLVGKLASKHDLVKLQEGFEVLEQSMKETERVFREKEEKENRNKS